MARLEENRWGKSAIRLSKVHRGGDSDDFTDLVARVLLEGDVTGSYTTGDNSGVIPTDTMRNTVYGLAQEHLGGDLEAFGSVVAGHFLEHGGVASVDVELRERRWTRVTPTGFVGGGSEHRTMRLRATPTTSETRAGVDGLVVLKTTGSAFTGFPVDEFTILPEAADRLLATSVTSEWRYSSIPPDTTRAWSAARDAIIDHFFADWSSSVQHQGWLMAEGVLDAVPEIEEISFSLPNQHHLPFHLERFGLEDRGVIFHPVSEPYGDIAFTVRR